MNSKIIFLTLILGAFVTLSSCEHDHAHDHHHDNDDHDHVHNHQEEEQAVLEKLTKNYNVHIRPASTNGTNGPTAVTINMYILNIQRIDEVEGTWKLQVYYRQEWNDNRLVYDNKTVDFEQLTLTNVDSIWTPDVFFSNELHAEVHDLMKRNILVRIYPNGNVLYSSRITLTLFCPDASTTPRKSQIVCSTRQASYAYTTDDIVLGWKENEPIQLSDKIGMSNFVFKSAEAKNCDSTTNTGKYSCVRGDFTFRRSECSA